MASKKLGLALLILSFVATGSQAIAQNLPDSIVKKIDTVFQKWNNPNSPGSTVGIIRNDSLIFSKGYGMANLEYSIPNKPTTIYHMASVSKQFTAWCILMLAEQGRLKLSDDIRKYLPWFPDLKEKITIQHLLNHTSGIRDQWQLLAISGTRLDDVIKQDHVVKMLGRQQALNFKPGEEYSYSNSGYTMMAEIVKEVTGKTLRQFADSAIFRPLGMTSTHFHDNYEEIEKDRAYSYFRSGANSFSNAVLSYSTAGATSLFTNIPDLAKWAMNLYNPAPDNKARVLALTTKGKLNSGKEITYANGIAVNDYKGWLEYSHSGGDAGFVTYFTVLPELKMSILVFGNLGEINVGGKAYELADLFVNEKKGREIKPDKTPDNRKDSAAAILADESGWKKFEGNYVRDDGRLFRFEIKNRRMYYSVNMERNFLIPALKDSFSIPGNPEVNFLFRQNGNELQVDQFTNSRQFHFTRYEPFLKPGDGELQSYTGLYYSPETDSRYTIVLRGHQLWLTHNKYPDAALGLLGPDHMVNSNWWMNHLTVIRDKQQKIIGFNIDAGRIMHLRFNKME